MRSKKPNRKLPRHQIKTLRDFEHFLYKRGFSGKEIDALTLAWKGLKQYQRVQSEAKCGRINDHFTEAKSTIGELVRQQLNVGEHPPGR